VLTADDVAMESFFMSRCGPHASDQLTEAAYTWVGNPAKQYPGQCMWPFHQLQYGPQAPPLEPPNSDVGTDGTVTNSFGHGLYQGDRAT
jgi:hypothetical protein